MRATLLELLLLAVIINLATVHSQGHYADAWLRKRPLKEPNRETEVIPGPPPGNSELPPGKKIMKPKIEVLPPRPMPGDSFEMPDFEIPVFPPGFPNGNDGHQVVILPDSSDYDDFGEPPEVINQGSHQIVVPGNNKGRPGKPRPGGNDGNMVRPLPETSRPGGNDGNMVRPLPGTSRPGESNWERPGPGKPRPGGNDGNMVRPLPGTSRPGDSYSEMATGFVISQLPGILEELQKYTGSGAKTQNTEINIGSKTYSSSTSIIGYFHDLQKMAEVLIAGTPHQDYTSNVFMQSCPLVNFGMMKKLLEMAQKKNSNSGAGNDGNMVRPLPGNSRPGGNDGNMVRPLPGNSRPGGNNWNTVRPLPGVSRPARFQSPGIPRPAEPTTTESLQVKQKLPRKK